MSIKLVNDDCIHYMENNKHDNTIIVTDPPFNIGYHYTTYKDRMEHEKYLELLKKKSDLIQITVRTDTLPRSHISVCSVYRKGA